MTLNKKNWDDYDVMAAPVMSSLSPNDKRVNYEPLGGTKTKACANCEFFSAFSSSCSLVIGDIVPTGLCDLWLRERSADEIDAQYAQPVKIVKNRNKVVGLLEQVKALLTGTDTASKDMSLERGATGFKMIGPEDNYWVAYWSNNTKDRDGEFFTEAAHDAYIERLDAGTTPMPSLFYWHQPEFKHGQAFFVDRIGHTVFAVGEFDNTPAAQAMKAYYKQNNPEGVSHGFLYPSERLIDGVYTYYDTFEISPLPPDVAANPYTAFSSIEATKEMTITAEKKQQLINRLGAETVSQILGEADSRSKALEALGVQFKDLKAPPSFEEALKSVNTRMDAIAEALASNAETFAIMAKEITDLKAASTKKDPDDDGDDDSTEAGDTDKDKGKGKPFGAKKETAATAPDPNFAAIAQVLTGLQQGQKELSTALGGMTTFLNQQFGVPPQSAQSSQMTAVPPTDPALAHLIDRMNTDNKEAAQLPPGQQPQVNPLDMAALLFPTQFQKR